MKKSQMIKKIMKVLRQWEGSKPEPKMAKEILAVCEANGMLPPGAEKDKITFSNYATGEITGYSYDRYEWEPEKN